MPSEQTITLIQPMLGMEPYVLLEFRIGDEGPDDLRVGVRAGGGVDDVGAALLMALTNLPGNGGPLGDLLAEIETEYQHERLSPTEMNRRDGVLYAIARIRDELGLGRGD